MVPLHALPKHGIVDYELRCDDTAQYLAGHQEVGVVGLGQGFGGFRV